MKCFAVTVGLGIAVALVAPALAQATTFTVTTTTDSNDGGCTVSLCSFRDALNAADGAPAGSTVIVPAGTYKGAMLGGNGVWSPTGQYTIQGAGASKTIIDGNGLGRTFAFYGQITVAGVTVTGGKAPFAGCTCGGAFEVRQGGFLTLINSIVQGNSAPGGGGGIDVDGQSNARLQNVLISQNTSPAAGAGIRVETPSSGNTGTLTMTNVTVSGNSTSGSGNGAGLDNSGSTTGTNVTFAGNVSAANGGAVMNESGGTLALTNSTIATNTATALGGGVRSVAATGNVTLRNTIVTDGCSGTSTPALASQGHNLDAGNSCGFTGSGDLINTDPKLGAFGDNGGVTALPTLALKTGSPAIDVGDNAACPATDERGISRPQNGRCDIGAVEYAPPAVALGATTGVSTGAAILNGTVDPNLRATTYHFEYGTTAAYGSSTAASGAGLGATPTTATASLGGLRAGTTYHYRLVATNGDGTNSTSDATFTTSGPPPTLTQVRQSAKRWVERTKPHRKGKPKLPIGTTFSFTLNQSARVTFTFTQSAGGRRVAGKCVARTNRNQRKPKCSRALTRGTLSIRGTAGKNMLRFKGRVTARTLTPGRYTVAITAVNAAGQRSAPNTLTFTIAKP